MTQTPSPLTQVELEYAAKAVMGALFGTTQYVNSQAMSALTLATATVVHHVSREQGMNRAALLDSFFDRLVDTLVQIDARERAGGG